LKTLVDLFDRSRLNFNQAWNYNRHTVKNLTPAKQWIFAEILQGWDRYAADITFYKYDDVYCHQSIVEVVDFVERKSDALISWGITPIDDDTIALVYYERTSEQHKAEYTLQEVYDIVQRTQMTVCALRFVIGE